MASKGRQEPTHRYCRDYKLTEGPFAVEMACRYGMKPHPWQELVLNDWLAMDGGRLANRLCLLPVPRQNGKTGCCDPRETWGLVRHGEQILHTAQEFQTAQKAFNRLRKKFGMCKNDPLAEFPELNALVDRYTTSANQMVLDLKNGGHIEFRTRGSGGDMGRGGTFDLVVIDEAQSYTEEQDAALSPLNAAAPSGSPQTIMMGTVPDPGKRDKGGKFTALRKELIENPFVGACLHEWSTSDVGDVTDRSRWYEANPSLGYQLLESGLEKDLHTMSPETFAREHLGWWPEGICLPDFVIPSNAFQGLAIDNPPTSGRCAYGVKFAPDGSGMSLCAARLHDGKVYIEQVAREPMGAGLTWLAEWLAERKTKGCCVVIDGRSGAPALVDKLGRMPKGYVVTPSAAQVTAAAVALVDHVNERKLEWWREQADLLDSATTSTRRKIGTGISGGWGFGGENPTPIEAASLALWGVLNSKRDPERKAVVW